MKNSNFRITTLLAILLLLAISLPLICLSGFVRADRERSRPHERAIEGGLRTAGKQTPPEDWFVTQRVTHGGIPVGALERAAAQAAALAELTEQSNTPLARARWAFVGPTNIGGRVVDIAVDPIAADTLYIAAATGGVWKSTDRGAQFTSIWPTTNPQSMGALVITPDGTLLAGTGEANPGGGSITYGGGGMFRSVDGGATWQRVGLGTSGAIGRLIVDPANSQRIFAAVTGRLYNPGGQRGVYQSTDGGSTWRRVLAGDNSTTGAVDLAIDPGNSNRIFAAMWDHLREPDLRTYGGVGSGVYRSTDGGTTWERLTNGLPASSPTIGRIGIAVAPSNPQRVFAIVIETGGLFQGLYRSEDGGDSWAKLRDSSTLSGAQSTYGWWFGRIWVDPADQNHVFGAGVYLCESRDGGASFTGQFSPHADDHAMTWDAKVPGRVYLGNDGGTYRSDVNGSNDQWTFAVSQPFTQFYSVDVSEQDTTRVVGGAQDNGVNRSYGGAGWNTYIFGDGEEALIDPVNQNDVYGCSQYGECSRSTNGGSSSIDFTGATVSSRRNWFSPLQFDPSNPAVLYYAGNQVNRSVDHAVHWSVISPDLTGGPGRDPNYPFGTITTVAAAKADSNRLFAGTDDGRLWFTSNLGVNWTQVTDSDLPGTWVTRVAADPANSLVAYATFSGFRSGSQLPYVLKTTDGGTTWTSIVGNLPQAPVNDLVVIGSTLYVATDVGVFSSVNGGTSWSTAGTKLPNVPVTDLEYVASSNSLYAATFGRGIFSLALP
jgi:photosystem II stability/assembly factor-like uncharacterized protein